MASLRRIYCIFRMPLRPVQPTAFVEQHATVHTKSQHMTLSDMFSRFDTIPRIMFEKHRQTDERSEMDVGRIKRR